MDLFGIGPLELLVVLVIALLVLGPERMVRTARSAGKTIRRIRSELREVDPRRLLEEPLREALDEGPEGRSGPGRDGGEGGEGEEAAPRPRRRRGATGEGQRP